MTRWDTGHRSNSRKTVPCVGAGESAFAATWIGLEPAFQKGPVDQIGLLHMINPMTGFNEYCKWYAHDYPPKIHAYGCALTAETYYYFRVTEHGSSTSAAYYITDCGTSSSYSNCTDKYITDSVWENTYGVDMEEVDYGPDCQSRAMGTPGDPANIGTDANPIEGYRPGGMWSTRDLLYFYQVSATCGHYDYNSTTIPSTDQHTKMGYYDDRN